jgi:hypothetical protein
MVDGTSCRTSFPQARTFQAPSEGNGDRSFPRGMIFVCLSPAHLHTAARLLKSYSAY